MIARKDYRDTAKGLADLLPYAAMVDDGVMLCKDGSLLASCAAVHKIPHPAPMMNWQRFRFR